MTKKAFFRVAAKAFGFGLLRLENGCWTMPTSLPRLFRTTAAAYEPSVARREPLVSSTVYNGAMCALCVENAAIFWYNYNRSGSMDQLSLHAACPVLIGEKWGKLLRYSLLVAAATLHRQHVSRHFFLFLFYSPRNLNRYLSDRHTFVIGHVSCLWVFNALFRFNKS